MGAKEHLAEGREVRVLLVLHCVEARSDVGGEGARAGPGQLMVNLVPMCM